MQTDTQWAPIKFEERRWQAPTQYGDSRFVLRRHSMPYRAALVPRIADVRFRPSANMISATLNAQDRIMRFDAERRLSRAGAALEAMLARLEAAHSQQLESLTATGSKPDLRTRLTEPTESAGSLAWRTTQSWLGGSDISPHDARYVPPHPDRIPAAMEDLVQFVQRKDINMVAKAAIALAQFEAIQPLSAGNGIEARRLLQSILQVSGTVPISIGLLLDARGYRNALAAYRNGNVDRIGATVSDAAFAATTLTEQLGRDIERMYGRWRRRLVSVRKDSVLWRLLPTLWGRPIVSTATVARDFQVSTMSAQRAIKRLVRLEILREYTGRRRSRRWVADQVIECFDDFIFRSGQQ